MACALRRYGVTDSGSYTSGQRLHTINTVLSSYGSYTIRILYDHFEYDSLSLKQ
jgi:hypothetical protein